MIERIVHKSKSFEEAKQWELQQYRSMTHQELIAAARVLQRRAFGSEEVPDVRAACPPQSE
ncbi:MAG: hypothetical protein ACFCU3_00880 [Verrucomicrobiales bacterium]